MAFIALSGLYLTWVMSAANRVEDSISVMEGLDIAAVARGDVNAVSSAEESLEDVEDRIDSLSLRIAPIRSVAAVIGWIPLAGDQFRGPVSLVDQADAALNTTRALIPAAASLANFESIVGSSEFLSGEPNENIDSLMNQAERDAETAAVSLIELQEAGARLKGLTLLPTLRDKAKQGEQIERRLSAAVSMVTVAPDLIRSSQAMGITASEIAKSGDIASGDLDFESLGLLADQLNNDATIATAHASAFSVASEEAIPGSDVSKLAADLLAATESVSELASGLSGLISASQPAMDALRVSEGSLLRDGAALSQSLEILSSNHDQIGKAVADIDSGLYSLSELLESNSSIVSSSSMADLMDQADLLSSAGALLRDGPALASDLIAVDGDKTYLVIGQTSDELRAAGGFTSSAWTIQFREGALVSSSYIPVLEFDDQTARNLTPSAPSALSVHMDAGSLYLRDVGWDPHFPAVGELSSELYRINRSDEVDGVIAITQWGLIDLITAIGGIETAQGFIAAEDALEVIQQGTDTEGTGFLQYLFDGLVESIRGDASDSERLNLSRAIWNAFLKKDLMIYSPEDEVQSDLVSLGWAGAFPLDGTDRLGVVDSNIGWTKSDRSIDRGTVYEVDIRDVERPQARLDLTYRHTGVPIGRDCSEQRAPVESEFVFELARNSCYWDFFRIYTALGSEAFISPDLPLPVNSVADRIGRLEAGSSTFAHEFDSNGDYFSGLFAIEPGQGAQVSVRYDLPISVTQITDTGFKYQLHLVAQPGAQGRATTVRVLLPDGHGLVSSNHAPIRVTAGTAVFEFELTKDEILTLEMAPSADLSEVFEAGY